MIHCINSRVIFKSFIFLSLIIYNNLQINTQNYKYSTWHIKDNNYKYKNIMYNINKKFFKMKNYHHSKGLSELQRKISRRKRQRVSILVLFSLLCSITLTVTIVRSIQFNQKCAGYLKQAADANTPELALERINVALEYIEANNLTDGYTSILWKTEDENVGFWYRNIVACQKGLKSCLESSQLEKTNVLMKVRESLTDEGEKGTVLTIPDGISRHPYNWLWAIINTISFIMGSFLFLCTGSKS